MSSQIEEAARAIHAGGVVAYPTEAVFGLGADPFNRAAVMRLLQLKQRSVEKGLIIIVEEWSKIEPWVEGLSESNWQKVQSFRGAHPRTWVLPVNSDFPAWICGAHRGRVAVRIPQHSLALELCHRVNGPIVSTSANIATRPPARTYQEVEAQFGQNLDVCVKGDVGQFETPSEICDAQSGQILRGV